VYAVLLEDAIEAGDVGGVYKYVYPELEKLEKYTVNYCENLLCKIIMMFLFLFFQ